MSAIESTSSLKDLEDKLDRIIELLEEVVGNQKAKADGTMPGFERVYGCAGPNGAWIAYPDNEPHYVMKAKPC